ncbi:hypothetical protein HDE_00696 [Halotydeus destructor]|nr:hypothetical protein HDE_00696 [Halotydeus destructor]
MKTAAIILALFGAVMASDLYDGYGAGYEGPAHYGGGYEAGYDAHESYGHADYGHDAGYGADAGYGHNAGYGHDAGYGYDAAPAGYGAPLAEPYAAHGGYGYEADHYDGGAAYGQEDYYKRA